MKIEARNGFVLEIEDEKIIGVALGPACYDKGRIIRLGDNILSNGRMFPKIVGKVKKISFPHYSELQPVFLPST